MPKYTLLEMVQKVLSDMDAEPVNSIGDTTESDQIASIIEDTFYVMITNRIIPEHNSFLKLTSLSNSEFPTHFEYPANTNGITGVWYDKSDDNSFEYKPVEWMNPMDFIHMIDNFQTDYKAVKDREAGTTLRIRNNKQPEYYTSFDDKHLVMDSYDASVDTTLTTAKSRAYGTTYPTFTIDDNFVPDIDEHLFPYLLAESKSVSFSLLAGGADQKIEQQARRQKSYLQNDKYRSQRPNKWTNYGRT